MEKSRKMPKKEDGFLNELIKQHLRNEEKIDDLIEDLNKNAEKLKKYGIIMPKFDL